MPGSAASKKSSRRKSRSGALAEASSIHTATRSANFTRGGQARSSGQDRITRSARTTGTSSSECANAPKDKQVPRVGEAVDTPGACAMILIRAPPTMACGTIRRVVLDEMRRSGKSPGVLHMQQDIGQETLPRVSMEVGIKYEGIPQLVPAMGHMPQMHHVRRG